MQDLHSCCSSHLHFVLSFKLYCKFYCMFYCSCDRSFTEDKSCVRLLIHTNKQNILKPPSHSVEMKQHQPEWTIFKIRATFGQKCHIIEIFLECRSNTKNSLRTRIEWFLHIPSVLALECISNVVLTQQKYLECCHNVQNALWTPYDCSSIAARITLVGRCVECCTNAVRVLTGWLPNTVRASKNSNKMQLEYLEFTSNVLRM